MKNKGTTTAADSWEQRERSFAGMTGTACKMLRFDSLGGRTQTTLKHTTMKNEIQKAQGAEVTFVIPSAEEIGRLSSMSKKFKLTMDYKTADDWAKIKDQPLRCFYKGLKEIPNEKGEQVCCGIFVSETECFLSGQMALIEAVIGLPVNTPLEITYTGKKTNKSSVGSTMLFNVVTLGE